MPNSDAKRLAIWLRSWREELALAVAGELPEGLPADIPPPQFSSLVKPFHTLDVQGEIRLLNPWLVRDLRRPLYFAVLKEWLDGLWLIAPFGRFSEPGTVGEWNTGRGESDPRQAPLNVLCLWNAHTVPHEVLCQSWFIDILEQEELEKAWEVFRHVATGKPLPSQLTERVGPPLYHPADPRHDYLAEEAAGLRPLGRLAEEYVDRLQDLTHAVSPPAESETEDHWFDSNLGRREPSTLDLHVPALALRVTFRQDRHSERVVARVTLSADPSRSSSKLDGGVVMHAGKVVGKFSRGRAEFKADSLEGQIALRDRQGRPLVVEVEAKPKTAPIVQLPALARECLDRLAAQLIVFFKLELPTLAAYSDAKTDKVVKAFPSATGDPYEARLVQDSLGRWFLRVYTKDAEAAKFKLRLEIKPEAPEMQFTAVAPAMFFAEVPLSESMATALKSGNLPVFSATE